MAKHQALSTAQGCGDQRRTDWPILTYGIVLGLLRPDPGEQPSRRGLGPAAQPSLRRGTACRSQVFKQPGIRCNLGDRVEAGQRFVLDGHGHRPSAPFHRAVSWLLAAKVLLPGLSILERAVARVRSRANAHLHRRLVERLTPFQRERLDGLVAVPDGAGYSHHCLRDGSPACARPGRATARRRSRRRSAGPARSPGRWHPGAMSRHPEVMAPPSNPATTRRPLGGGRSALHSVGIGAILCVSLRLCCRRTFVNQSPDALTFGEKSGIGLAGRWHVDLPLTVDTPPEPEGQRGIPLKEIPVNFWSASSSCIRPAFLESQQLNLHRFYQKRELISLGRVALCAAQRCLSCASRTNGCIVLPVNRTLRHSARQISADPGGFEVTPGLHLNRLRLEAHAQLHLRLR